MSLHIQAEKSQIGKTVLMPGDPIRAEYIADNYIDDEERLCFNGVRGMFGYTGRSQSGKKFSVHPSGMGQPSLSIYVNELFMSYDVETIIRVGTFGSYHKDIPCKSIFIPSVAITDSNMNPGTIRACPCIDLFKKAVDAANKHSIRIVTGNVFSSDVFYDLKQYKKDEKKDWETMAGQGVIGVEMESHALFCLGEFYKKKTLTVLVASDNLVTGEHLSSKERETSIEDMMKIVLEII